MKRHRIPGKAVTLLASLLLFSPLLRGEQAASVTDAVNFCPGGLAFGVLAVNYEHLFHGRHGLMVRYDREEVPDTYTDAKIEASAHAFFLNYRWHPEEGMEGFYFGPYLRHRTYDGSGKLDGEGFDFRITERTVGVNMGKRWVWNSGFNLNLAFGYGAITVDRDRPADPSVRQRIGKFEKEYGNINPLYGEFSVGYAF